MRFKKKIGTVVAILCSCVIFVGCSSVNDNLTAKDIQKSIVDTGLVKNMEETGTKGLKRYYGLNASDFDSVVLYTPKSSMEVDEMLIVKVKDKSQIEGLEDAIDNRINSQLQSFGSYGPEQCALVNDYELKTKGKYVFFAISENAEELKEAFKESIK
ncbi:MAG: DUF4358 domain-containing protein [Intestinibacter sp.]